MAYETFAFCVDCVNDVDFPILVKWICDCLVKAKFSLYKLAMYAISFTQKTTFACRSRLSVTLFPRCHICKRKR